MALQLVELPLCGMCADQVAYLKVLSEDGVTMMDICDPCLEKVDFEMPEDSIVNIEGLPEFNGAFGG